MNKKIDYLDDISAPNIQKIRKVTNDKIRSYKIDYLRGLLQEINRNILKASSEGKNNIDLCIKLEDFYIKNATKNELIDFLWKIIKKYEDYDVAIYKFYEDGKQRFYDWMDKESDKFLNSILLCIVW